MFIILQCWQISVPKFKIYQYKWAKSNWRPGSMLKILCYLIEDIWRISLDLLTLKQSSIKIFLLMAHLLINKHNFLIMAEL